MKPCAKNREALVWLSLGELEPREAVVLRAHMERCEGCRRYLAEVSGSIQTLEAAKPGEGIEVSARFHQRVVRAVRIAKPRPGSEALADFLRSVLLDWRVALPVAGAVAAAFVILSPGSGPPPAAKPAESARHDTPGPARKSDAVMTAASYWWAADQSLEELDKLLTEQGHRPPPPGPVYTPMMAMLAELPE
jgi:anti-sigma factor RsiW